jgi:predicted Zn-dependent protease
MSPWLFRGLLIALVMASTGCAVNPVTGRQDFVMMSEAQELALGRQASGQVESQMPLVADEALQQYVQSVGDQLAMHSHRSRLDYRFRVVDSPEINAFALPGGYVYLNRGLLAYLNSEAELAAVLGHEIGHVTARHGVRQQSMAMGAGLLAEVATIGTGMRAVGDLGNMLGTAMVRGYGREMELEADGLGAEYLARAGYRPDAVLKVIGVLKDQDSYTRQRADAEGRPVPDGYHGLFATHPTHDQRLQQVVSRAEGLTTGDRQRTGRDEYLKMIDGLIYGDSPEQGIVRDNRFYHAGLDMALEFPAGWVVVNRPDLLLAHTRDEQGFIGLTVERLQAERNPQALLRQRVGGRRLVQEERLQGAGFEGWTAIIPGDQARRVAALVKGDQVFLFVAGVRGRAPLEQHDADFRRVIQGFRGMTKADAELASPLRVRLQRARAGDTYATLAAQSPLGEQAEARLRLLNGQWPAGEPGPGDWIKVVR